MVLLFLAGTDGVQIKELSSRRTLTHTPRSNDIDGRDGGHTCLLRCRFGPQDRSLCRRLGSRRRTVVVVLPTRTDSVQIKELPLLRVRICTPSHSPERLATPGAHLSRARFARLQRDAQALRRTRAVSVDRRLRSRKARNGHPFVPLRPRAATWTGSRAGSLGRVVVAVRLFAGAGAAVAPLDHVPPQDVPIAGRAFPAPGEQTLSARFGAPKVFGKAQEVRDGDAARRRAQGRFERFLRVTDAKTGVRRGGGSTVVFVFLMWLTEV
jgi:hypothetical protein